jgi:hypothetical protein
MNISAFTSIKSGIIGGSAGGSFIDPDKFKESDINYFVQCQVTNQVVMAEDVTQLQMLQLRDGDKLAGNEFTKIYGDSFISGFIEGGEINALISIKLKTPGDERADSIARARLEAVFGQGKAVKDAKVSSSETEDLDTNDLFETTITLNWNGGGKLLEPNDRWNIDAVAAATSKFPDLVAKTPQRI